MTEERLLDQLCGLYGIAPEYTDIYGVRRYTSAQTKCALLHAMGVPADTDAAIADSIDTANRQIWLRMLPPVTVLHCGRRGGEIDIRLPATMADATLNWKLRTEDGSTRQGKLSAGRLPIRDSKCIHSEEIRRLGWQFPFLPEPGYHRLSLEAPGCEPQGTSLIAAPARCYTPPGLSEGRRIWGMAVQLYGIRTRHNWGIGEFTDLEPLINWAARAGADIVGVSPVHALFPHAPERASPYTPSTRLYCNVLHIDVEATADFGECADARSLVESSAFQARLRALRASELVDYAGVAAAKFEILEILYRHFRATHLEHGTPRGQAFRDFQNHEGEPLWRHALFEALQEHFHRQDAGIWGWPAWPAAYQDPDSGAVAAFRAANAARIEFFQYLQWQAHIQLEGAGRRSMDLGLAAGLYQDLAVGINPGGSETWSAPSLYAGSAYIGAPPDDFHPGGQNWGLSPMIPGHLMEAAYQPFIAVLRKNMRYAGALRIDHVMGLMRLFWVPEDQDAADGAYVSYPFDDLLGILALESCRNCCLVVGEDLGTVPAAVREAMSQLDVLSSRVLYFEKTWENEFRAPADYPVSAVAATGNHDLPTLKGYWRGTDIERRSEFGLFPDQTSEDHWIATRARDRAGLLAALARENLLPEGMTPDPCTAPEMTAELACAIQQWLARAPSSVFLVPVEDLLGEDEQANLPGAPSGYTNWRRKARLDLEAWDRDRDIQRLVAVLCHERRTPGRFP